MLIKNLINSNHRTCLFLYSGHGTSLNSFRLKSKSSQNVTDYSKTLNLPNAGAFELSMKNVCSNEEKIKNITDFDGLYEWQAKHLSHRPTFTLHDGPPYANGDIHIGHMVNKVLKDIYNRYKLLSGHRIDFVPGWDCHGLPIELNAIKSLKKKKQDHHSRNTIPEITFNKNDPVDIRKNASEYAKACINLQMNSFKRMNLLADWNRIYRTFDANYMCDELDLFYNLYEKKLIYRDYMPVYWSVSSQTALAEFELEYKSDHKSDAFYVAFEMINYSDQLKSYLNGNEKLYAPIWTTTPWSLPANKAIAFNLNMKYALLRVENRGVYLVLNELVDQVKHSVPFFKDAIKLDNVIDGHFLLNSTYKSPFLSSDQEMFPLIPSEHVGSKQGTGLVHVAPALGQDDFKLGIKFSLPTNCIIDELGKYSNDDPILQKHNLIGKQVLDENTTEQIRGILSESLIFENKYTHSYPYDWRTKKPCIIRSSMQWFIDTNKLKEESMEALKQIKIRPPNVSNSMVTTLASRPYWCISRQRAWGLPIPCLYDVNDKDKKNAYLSLDLIEKVKSLIKQDGNVDFWWSNKYDHELTELNGKEKKLTKSNDIFDIWFDSGSSFNSVLSKSSNADLYCEGVDQFSGWFQSSLLLSIAMNKKAPYKSLLVHGFVVDENNRKMSKSVGNVIEPIQAIEGIRNKLPQSGLDVLRFWIAHEYYKQHIQIGSKILENFNKRVFEIRSILRFIVGNLNDFEESNLVSYESMLPIDKYILSKLNNLNELVIQNYEDMHLNKSLGLIENFFLTQLSSFYIKSVKDRLYCEPASSIQRRSAQTAFYYILLKSVLMIGPVMPHLAEEAFHYSILNNSKNGKSLFRSQLTYENSNKQWSNQEIENLFQVVNLLREKYHELVMSQNSAMFRVNINCNESLYNLLKSHLKTNRSNAYDWLTECFSCAELSINLQATSMDLCNINLNIDTTNYSGHLEITKTNKLICNRCRKYNCQTDTKDHQLCNRCYELTKTI